MRWNVKKNWYSVKTIYLIKSVGRPKNKDKNYFKETALCEERVVLFRASNFDQALKLAENEAKKYCKYSFRNKYDQIVKTKYLGMLDAFQLFESPNKQVEIYSYTEVLDGNFSNKEIWAKKFGKNFGKREKMLRIKFQNSELKKT